MKLNNATLITGIGCNNLPPQQQVAEQQLFSFSFSIIYFYSFLLSDRWLDCSIVSKACQIQNNLSKLSSILFNLDSIFLYPSHCNTTFKEVLLLTHILNSPFWEPAVIYICLLSPHLDFWLLSLAAQDTFPLKFNQSSIICIHNYKHCFMILFVHVRECRGWWGRDRGRYQI